LAEAIQGDAAQAFVLAWIASPQVAARQDNFFEWINHRRTMIVSHGKKLIFFHNPKCAGMSFRDVLKPYHDDAVSFWGLYPAPYFRNSLDHSHLRLWEMQALFPRIMDCAETYNSLIFVRNPYLRFISALNEHTKKFQQQIDLAAMTPAQRVTLAEQFIEQALHISRITTDWRFVHFSPQIWFLKFGDRLVPRHIIPMDVNSEFARTGLAILGMPDLKMPWINPSPVDLSMVLGSAAVQKFVRDFYADDFSFFLADDALASLAALPELR
jgi:hypothetical protein